MFVDISNDPLFDESPALGAATKASISHLVALGERSGKRVRFIGRGFGYEDDEPLFKGRFLSENKELKSNPSNLGRTYSCE